MARRRGEAKGDLIHLKKRGAGIKGGHAQAQAEKQGQPQEERLPGKFVEPAQQE